MGSKNPLNNQAIQTGKKVLKGPKIEARVLGSEAIFGMLHATKERSSVCC